ncbi:MAG TPA: hypothetical protein VGQ87_02100 [Patescibacteria group bacterium]|nr:hypothetical protein [Patescibacteria group bacterium]
MKIQRAGVLGQQNIVERYTDQAERIRARLGTGPTPKLRRHRGVLLGINGTEVSHEAEAGDEHAGVMPPPDSPFELDGQERAPGYGV